MRNIRIECAKHRRTITKNIDEDGNVYLSATTNHNGHGAFKVCGTDHSALDGLEVTVCLSDHQSFDEAATAAIKASESLSVEEQKRTENHISANRETGLALEAQIAKNDVWVTRKLVIDHERCERRRLGYIE